MTMAATVEGVGGLSKMAYRGEPMFVVENLGKKTWIESSKESRLLGVYRQRSL
jgi:hypothetical protein